MTDESKDTNSLINPDDFNELSKQMRLLEEKSNRRLPESERAIWEQFFLEPLKLETDDETKKMRAEVARMCIGGFALGFSPSECSKLIMKAIQGSRLKESEKTNGDLLFWIICSQVARLLPDIGLLSRTYSSELVGSLISLIDEARSSSISRRIDIVGQQLAITCLTCQAKYEDVYDRLDYLLEVCIHTKKGRENVIHFWGYVSALQDFDIRPELDKLIQIDLPDKEYEEEGISSGAEDLAVTTAAPVDLQVAIAKRVIEDISKNLSESTN
ncbi:MAG: hypothetical protein V1894_05155, partial [Chloroflexota bacterium]